MKLLYSALTLALAVPTLAQEPPVPPTPTRSVAGQALRTISTTSADPEWFSKTVDLDIKNATLAEAIKKVLDAAGVKTEKVDDQTKGNKSKLSLKLNDVNARDAMAAVARLYGAQAYVLNEDGKTSIELKNRVPEPTFSVSSALPAPFRQNITTFAPSFPTTGIFVQGAIERYKELKELADKKLDIEVKDGTVRDVVTQLGEKAGIAVELEDGLKGDGKVSIVMRGVSVGNALDNAANLLGCGWKAEKDGDKVKVSFSKKHPAPWGRIGSTGVTGRAQTLTTPTPGVPFLNDLPIVGSLFRAPLPNKRVSLDKKNTDARECLKEILQQAEVSYALADDLPTEARSFTFSNVPLSTALDMLCESMEVGWTTEAGSDGKPIVRVGKRYKSRSGRSSNSELFLNTRSLAPELSRLRTRPSRRTPVDFLIQ